MVSVAQSGTSRPGDECRNGLGRRRGGGRCGSCGYRGQGFAIPGPACLAAVGLWAGAGIFHGDGDTAWCVGRGTPLKRGFAGKLATEFFCGNDPGVISGFGSGLEFETLTSHGGLMNLVDLSGVGDVSELAL